MRSGYRLSHVARLLTAALLIACPSAARAFSSGITSLSFGGGGCNECHSGGSLPSVTLIGPTTVEPDSTNEFLLQINATGSQNQGGLNVSALAGMLGVGGSDPAFTQAVIGTGGRDEITHTQRKNASAGAVTFSFLWTAPSSPTNVTLVAWGNAVDGDGLPFGDRANMDTLNVAVGDTTVTPVIDGYKCYQGKDLKDPKFAKITLAASDQFVEETVELKKVKFVCVPVSIDGSVILDPDTHLICYQIKGANLEPKPRVMITSQLQLTIGSQLDLKKPKLLCVPGSKELLE